MDYFWRLATPKYLRIGNLTIKILVEIFQSFGIKKPLLIIDPVLMEKNKKAKEIVKFFINHNWGVFNAFSTNPTTQQIMESVECYLNCRPDGVFVMGGGSAIDLAKATILVAINGGTIVDYFSGKKKGEIAFPSFIVLPTTCGTGSEASPYAVILDSQHHKKRGIENYNFLPNLIIRDDSFLQSLDSIFIAATAMDALSHVWESFLSRKASSVTRAVIRGLFIGIINNIEMAVIKKDEIAIENMMNIAFSSRLLYSRTGLTIAHALSHPLGAYTNMHHGLAVVFFIPKTLEFNYSKCRKEMSESLDLMGFGSLDQFFLWFEKFCNKSGITTAIKKAITDNELPIETLAADAMDSSNIPSNPRVVTSKDLKNIILGSIDYWEKK